MFNSGNIRRQIGIVKKRILQQCELIQQLLLDYNVQKKQPVFEQLSNDEIAEFRRDLTEAHFQLHRSYSKIQQLHDSWSDARNADRKEEEVYADYINKYGDYTKAVQEAVTSLENADEILNAVDAEFMKRHLPIPADREDNTSILQKASADLHNTSNLKVETDSRTNPHHRDQTIGQAAATMNFVDASILSRLDLPTFDGNLLEYAEFFARFRALIGDKKQLDDATKFSLLKSCLKGRALQSIQGLALTGQNYHIALDILKSRYDDKVTTRHILFSQLANLPSCDPEGKHLQSLYNKMFSLTRQFCSYEDDSKEIALGAILLNKLPRYVRSKIYDRTGNTHNLAPSELLDVLTDIVHKESTLQEIDFHCKRFHQQHEEGYVGVQKQQKRSTPFNPSNRSSSETRSSPNKRTKFRKCSFCESIQHNTFTCTKFITPQQRAQVVRDKRLCFNCLSSKHRTRECLSNRCCQNCAKRHHTSICNLPKRQEPRRPSRLPVHDKTTQRQERKSQVHFVDDSMQDAIDKDSNIKLQRNSDVVAALHDSRIPSAKQVLMMCTEVNVFNPSNPSKSTKTMAFLDSGSSKSYITTDLAKFLELPEDEKGEISMYTFGTSEATPFPVTLHTIGMYTSKGRRFLDVRALRTLTKELQTITFTDESIDELQWTTISRKPSLLIGSDYFWEILLSEEFYVKNLSNGYHLVHSSIGDIVTGKPLPTLKNSDYCYNSLPMSNETLDTLVHRFWDLETEGVVDSPRTAEDDECLRKFNETIYFDENEGRYMVQLLFKGRKEELPNNFHLAYARLLHNVKNLEIRAGMLEKYHDLIQDQLNTGIIEQVQDNHIPENCHYLPHHAVLKEQKLTTKIRCVYDGSAKTKGKPSLNELLHRGPVLLPDISGILLRTRMSRILISSDIEKAFLMVGLHEESRDFTRFLWLKDPHRAATPANIVTYRFRRVPFGLITSPFLLAGTIHYHLKMSENPLAQSILRNTYVDNIFYGAETVQEAKDFYRQSKRLFQKAGMNLRQYCSNSRELNEFFTEEEKSVPPNDNKILGISWNMTEDTLSIQLPTIPAEESNWTKRKVLKAIASTYDPLGLCSPALFSSKVFLQSLWKECLSWDQTLPSELMENWKTITSKWTSTTFTIPRQVTTGTKSSLFEIHVFSDASVAGYCAVAYIVEISETRKSSLLISKTRLAPLKTQMSIPRLELSAIALGSQLLKHISKNLDMEVTKTIIWSDSSVALTWIKTGKDLPLFIRNRVKSIRENAPDTKLRYVPSKDNPADVGSRGANADDLQNFQLWWIYEQSMWNLSPTCHL